MSAHNCSFLISLVNPLTLNVPKLKFIPFVIKHRKIQEELLKHRDFIINYPLSSTLRDVSHINVLEGNILLSKVMRQENGNVDYLMKGYRWLSAMLS